MKSIEIRVGSDPYNCPTVAEFYGLSAELVARKCAIRAFRELKTPHILLRLDTARWDFLFTCLESRHAADLVFEWEDEAATLTMCCAGHRVRCVPVDGQDPAIVVAVALEPKGTPQHP